MFLSKVSTPLWYCYDKHQGMFLGFRNGPRDILSVVKTLCYVALTKAIIHGIKLPALLAYIFQDDVTVAL